MPVRLASSPNGHGFTPLGRFPCPQSDRNERFQTAQAGLEPFVFDRPVIVTPYFRNRLSLSMQQSPSFQRIGYDNHRKSGTGDSIKTKVWERGGVVNRAGRSFLGRREPWGAFPISKPYCPLSTHSAASWRRRGRGSASLSGEERFPARRRCRTWMIDNIADGEATRSWRRGGRKRRSCSWCAANSAPCPQRPLRFGEHGGGKMMRRP